jgi:hypothetical protein
MEVDALAKSIGDIDPGRPRLAGIDLPRSERSIAFISFA